MSNNIDKINIGLKNYGLNYINRCNNDYIKSILEYINPSKYDELNKFLLDYEYDENYECCFTGKIINDPIDQLVNRIQGFNKYGC